MIHPLKILTVIFITGSLVLFAQEISPKLTLTTKAQKEIVVKENGKQLVKRVSAETVKKGDILVYTITYKNEGNAPCQSASIVNPVPAGTVYILNSAAGKDCEITYSIDGGKYFQKPPVKYIVKKHDGTTEEKTAGPEMYTHIMWTVKKLIPAGFSGEVEFKVQIK